MDALENSFHSTVVIPYNHEICKRYAEIKATLEATGRRIEDNDIWIAACAVGYSIPLISHNRSHFERVFGRVLISEA